ncbi:MAG: energy transducer TonB [Candidatus Eiseniibacteriota bacterium]
MQGFFIERGRAARRVALIALLLAVIGLVPLIAASLPPFQHPLRELIRQTARFGYEGPDQFVRRISLQQHPGRSLVTREMGGAIAGRRARSGGALRARRVLEPNAQPEIRPKVVGPGTEDEDLLQRAVSRLANVPVVQSEDLVITYASTPHYPQAEIDRGIEGRVMVQALIDTTGRVVDVQLLASTGVTPFEQSVAQAVWQYRFRPYRPQGLTREVYAIFRFAFRIY